MLLAVSVWPEAHAALQCSCTLPSSSGVFPLDQITSLTLPKAILSLPLPVPTSWCQAVLLSTRCGICCQLTAQRWRRGNCGNFSFLSHFTAALGLSGLEWHVLCHLSGMFCCHGWFRAMIPRLRGDNFLVTWSQGLPSASPANTDSFEMWFPCSQNGPRAQASVFWQN